MYQGATVTGIVVAYFVDYALAGTESWRLMLALSAIPALGVVALLARLPDTPRWYVMKGRMEEARATLPTRSWPRSRRTCAASAAARSARCCARPEMGFKGNTSLLLLPALVQVGSLVATLVSLSIVDRL